MVGYVPSGHDSLVMVAIPWSRFPWLFGSWGMCQFLLYAPAGPTIDMQLDFVDLLFEEADLSVLLLQAGFHLTP